MTLNDPERRNDRRPDPLV